MPYIVDEIKSRDVKYLPPEALEQSEFLMEPATVFSLGVILVDMLSGMRTPVQLNTVRQRLEDSRSDPFNPNEDMPNELYVLLSGCLNDLPEKRCGLQDIEENVWLKAGSSIIGTLLSAFWTPFFPAEQ